jgi:hypothetical protein
MVQSDQQLWKVAPLTPLKWFFQEEAMKKMLLISCAMLALTATAALAGGLNFNWGFECYTDGPITDKVWACNSNSNGTLTVPTYHTMTVSFKPTVSHEIVIATDVVIDGQTTALVIPAWWQFANSGACRINALSNNSGYGGTMASCSDAFGGLGSGGVTYYGDPSVATIPTPQPIGNRARIKATWAIAAASAQPVDASIEYFAMNIKVTNEKTNGVIGTTKCDGCLTPMNWVLNSIVPAYTDAGVLSDEVINTPIANQCIAWQGGGTGLCAATPAKNTTWGQVKSLYR